MKSHVEWHWSGVTVMYLSFTGLCLLWQLVGIHFVKFQQEYNYTHWRHLENTTELSVCGGDAVLCQITLSTCWYMNGTDDSDDACDVMVMWSLQHVEWFWRQTLICDGSESSLEQCRYRLHYNLEQCMIERRYVFMRCGKRNLPPEFDYWGNIRFATPNFESTSVMPGYSSLDYVDIYGAGILHGDRVAAVQVSAGSVNMTFTDL